MRGLDLRCVSRYPRRSFFFFQAEDGIRDKLVTGVQTCALPIYAFGTAMISVTVNDGQPSNNIVTRSFTVTVNPVNDPPTMDPLSDRIIHEESDRKSVV